MDGFDIFVKIPQLVFVISKTLYSTSAFTSDIFLDKLANIMLTKPNNDRTFMKKKKKQLLVFRLL